MLNEILTILTSEGNSIIKEIQRNLASTGTDATKKTSNSLRLQATKQDNKYLLQIYGRPFFMTVETGRKPTPDKKPPQTMVQNIREWVKARGMSESMVYAIATEINKKGTKLWRQGGRKDIVSNVITESKIAEIEKSILEAYAKAFLLNIKNLWNGNNRAQAGTI